MPKIILHAGFPKTGTTFLQSRVFASRESLLSKHKIFVPKLSANLTDALCTMFHDDPMLHITNRLHQLDPKSLRERINYYFGALDQDIRSTPCEMVVLSAEGVSNLHAGELARLKNWGDEFGSAWEVLYYVRSPVDWTRSVVQELMKGGRTISEMMEQLPLPYYQSRINAAMQVFGRDQVTVYSYEEACRHPRGLVQHFLSLLDVEEESSIPNDGEHRALQENRSMSWEAALILDRINTLRPLFREDGELGERRTAQEIFKLLRIDGGPFRLPPAMEAKVHEETTGDRQWLNEIFGIDFEEEQSRRHVESAFSDSTITSLALLLSDLMADLHYAKV